jgi:hypothetical protein
MDPGPHCVAERRIYRLMAFHESLTFERAAHHSRFKMVTAAGGVAYINLGVRQAKFD